MFFCGFFVLLIFLGRGLRDGVSWSGDLVIGRRVQRARGWPLPYTISSESFCEHGWEGLGRQGLGWVPRSLTQGV